MVSRATCQVFRASTFELRAGRSKLALRASGSGQKGGLSDPSAQRKRSLQAVASGLFFIHYPASLELGPFDTLQELSTSARDPPVGMTEQKAALRASLGMLQNLRLENANSGEAVCSCSAARRRRVCRSRHTRGDCLAMFLPHSSFGLPFLLYTRNKRKPSASSTPARPPEISNSHHPFA